MKEYSLLGSLSEFHIWRKIRIFNDIIIKRLSYLLLILGTILMVCAVRSLLYTVFSVCIFSFYCLLCNRCILFGSVYKFEVNILHWSKHCSLHLHFCLIRLGLQNFGKNLLLLTHREYGL